MNIPMIHRFLSTLSTLAPGLRRFMLASARDLHQRVGFTAQAKPESSIKINHQKFIKNN